MERTHDTGSEAIERLALLLVSTPKPGFEDEFAELTRREIERLRLPSEPQEEREVVP